MASGLEREPLLTRATVTAVVGLGVGLLAAFGFSLDAETRDDLTTVALLLVPVAPIIAAWWGRRHVTPVVDPRDDAGTPLVPVVVDLPPL